MVGPSSLRASGHRPGRSSGERTAWRHGAPRTLAAHSRLARYGPTMATCPSLAPETTAPTTRPAKWCGATRPLECVAGGIRATHDSPVSLAPHRTICGERAYRARASIYGRKFAGLARQREEPISLAAVLVTDLPGSCECSLIAELNPRRDQLGEPVTRHRRRRLAHSTRTSTRCASAWRVREHEAPSTPHGVLDARVRFHPQQRS